MQRNKRQIRHWFSKIRDLFSTLLEESPSGRPPLRKHSPQKLSKRIGRMQRKQDKLVTGSKRIETLAKHIFSTPLGFCIVEPKMIPKGAIEELLELWFREVALQDRGV